MGSLLEGRLPNPQVCRLVNGKANGRQGSDWQQFLRAQYYPCSAYKEAVCGIKSPGNTDPIRSSHSWFVLTD